MSKRQDENSGEAFDWFLAPSEGKYVVEAESDPYDGESMSVRKMHWPHPDTANIAADYYPIFDDCQICLPDNGPYIEAMVKICEDAGVTFMYSTFARQLVRPDNAGRVEGVIVEDMDLSLIHIFISVSWGRLCAALPLRKAYLFVLGSQTAALVVYAATFFVPDVAIVASAIVAILIVAAILIKLPDQSSVAFDSPRLRAVFGELWRPIFGTSVFAFLTGLMPWISGQYDGSVETMRLLSLASSAAVLLSLIHI